VSDVVFEQEGQIAWLRLNRPERLNAYGAAMRAELQVAWKRFQDDPALRVAIITGEGRAFCAGRDIKEQAEQEVESYTANFLGANRPALTVIRPGEKPLISAINGFALGLGFFVAMAGDIRIASEAAQFGVPELETGLLGPWYLAITEMLPKAVSAELILMGDRISAQRAYEIGLINRVVPADELAATARAYAERMCALPQAHLQETLRMMRRAQPQPSAELLDAGDDAHRFLFQHADTAAAAAAFAARPRGASTRSDAAAL
jgi:enoyl-CoA hydratase/carnithine racemase